MIGQFHGPNSPNSPDAISFVYQNVLQRKVTPLALIRDEMKSKHPRKRFQDFRQSKFEGNSDNVSVDNHESKLMINKFYSAAKTP